MNIEAFIDGLRQYKSPNVFNPYADFCEKHDHDDSANIRLENLSLVLRQVIESPLEAIWIGRDLGHKGGRRTGLALTDEKNLEQASKYWGVPLKKATQGKVLSEQTAGSVWRALVRMEPLIMTWNVFPFHPHDSGDQFTNREHTAEERIAGEKILAELIKMTNPQRLIAIGNHASKSAHDISPRIPAHKVCHPAHGRQAQFASGISELYNLS